LYYVVTKSTAKPVRRKDAKMGSPGKVVTLFTYVTRLPDQFPP